MSVFPLIHSRVPPGSHIERERESKQNQLMGYDISQFTSVSPVEDRSTERKQMGSYVRDKQVENEFSSCMPYKPGPGSATKLIPSPKSIFFSFRH